MRFIDLFAGLGGFHIALSRLGHHCVFASEINKELAKLYEKNFEISNVHSDIKKVEEANIPHHDIMCAGFPCQPFSKAGKQLGIVDSRGQFLEDFERILKYHKPKYFILENVPHLRRHDRENSWKALKETLERCGYYLDDAILSPHEFGIPQIRHRIYIVGSRHNLKHFKFPEKQKATNLNIRTILDKNPKISRKMSTNQINCVNLWQRIIQEIPTKDPLPSFPVWGMEFGATYPFEKKAPHAMSLLELRKYKGACGKPLSNAKTKSEALAMLPSYSRVKQRKFPEWKIDYIKKNRQFYEKYKNIIQPHFNEIKKYPPSWQKLEWNCQNEKRNIYNHIIQFRASGIRVKKSNYSPALVVNSTQLPIIGWEKRYLTKEEAARLQDITEIELPENNSVAFKALGNAINVHIVNLIAKRLINQKG